MAAGTLHLTTSRPHVRGNLNRSRREKRRRRRHSNSKPVYRSRHIRIFAGTRVSHIAQLFVRAPVCSCSHFEYRPRISKKKRKADVLKMRKQKICLFNSTRLQDIDRLTTPQCKVTLIVIYGHAPSEQGAISPFAITEEKRIKYILIFRQTKI